MIDSILKPKRMEVLGLAFILMAMTPNPAFSSNPKHDFKEIGRQGVATQFIGNRENIEQYLNTRNGRKLRAWRILDESKRLVGIYAEGRAYGMHFYEIASDKRFLDGDTQNGPSNLPKGYSAEKI